MTSLLRNGQHGASKQVAESPQLAATVSTLTRSRIPPKLAERGSCLREINSCLERSN